MKSLIDLLAADAHPRTNCERPKQAGDHVRIGNNSGPVYEIVHIAGDKAWVRPLTNGQEGLVALERLRTA
jgi:hypothetical protein